MADCAIDAFHAFAFLVDDRIEGNRRFSRLTVADDQLALTASNRNHRINRLDARFQGGIDGFTRHNARSDALHGASFRKRNGSFAIQNADKPIILTGAQQPISNGNFDDLVSSFHRVAFFDLVIRAE